MRQRWAQLAAFHWRYDPAVVQDHLPDGLTVDQFDGSAWVGLIPFEMERIRPAAGPSLPHLGSFIEVNVRTYAVDRAGRRSVWFFSLDVPRSAAVAVARTAFGLPYCWAATSHVVDDDGHRYVVRRRWPHRARGFADMTFRVGRRLPDAEVSELDHFLSARWALSTVRSGRLERGRVDHERWPLHEVHDVAVHGDLIQAAGLPSPVGPMHARYSPGVDVRIAWLDRADHRSRDRRDIPR